MDRKRSLVGVAVICALLISPAMATDWLGTECCTPSDCCLSCQPADGCKAASCCDPKGCCSLESCGIEIGGWISSGVYGNQYGAKDNGPLTLRSYADGYTVDQVWVYAEKKADNGGSGLAVGGRVDFFWGADAYETQTYFDGGWDSEWVTSDDHNYGSAMPQLYGEIAYDALSVKIGHFFTIIGYEVVPAPDNFFYSHSHLLAYEPFTHMGALAEYKLNDRIKIQGGWTNGWDNGWLNPSNASTFLGGFSIDLSDRVSLTYATSSGTLWREPYTNLPDYVVTANLQSLVLNWKVTDRLTYVLQGDYQSCTESSFLPSETEKYYGMSQYLLYSINDRWAAGMRAEWFRGQYKWWVFPCESFTATEITLGLHYRPCSNVIFRPEIRWDAWSANPADLALAFDDHEHSSQFSGGFDCIVLF